MLDALTARILQVRPTYIGKVSSAEIENFADFTDSLAALTGHIEHLLDEPPQPPAAASANSAAPRLIRRSGSRDCPLFAEGRRLRRYRLRGRPRHPSRRSEHHPDDGTHNRAAHLRRSAAQDESANRRSDHRRRDFSSHHHRRHAQLRNSSRLSARRLHRLLCLRLRLTHQRTCCLRGKANRYDLRPGVHRLEPCPRHLRAALANLGNFARHACRRTRHLPDVAGIRRRFPVAEAAQSYSRHAFDWCRAAPLRTPRMQIQQANSGTMRSLAEILEVADDAQVEGRTSLVNHNAIVEAASTLRRIANRLASIATEPHRQSPAATRPGDRIGTRGGARRNSPCIFSRGSISSAAPRASTPPAAQAVAQIPLDSMTSKRRSSSSARGSRNGNSRESYRGPSSSGAMLLAELHSMRRLEVSDLRT